MDTIEPKEFEKSIIRNMANDIEIFLSDQNQLANSIRKFAAEANLDVFSPLEKSSYENIRAIGRCLMMASVGMAVDFAAPAAGVLKIYIDEETRLPEERRKVIRADFIVSKEIFEQKNGVDYDIVPDHDRAGFHVQMVSNMVNQSILKSLQTEAAYTKYITPQQAHSILEQGEIIYPLVQRPEFIGAIFAQLKINEFLIRRTAELYGKNPATVEADVNGDKERVLNALHQPLVPGRETFCGQHPLGKPLLH